MTALRLLYRTKSKLLQSPVCFLPPSIPDFLLVGAAVAEGRAAAQARAVAEAGAVAEAPGGQRSVLELCFFSEPGSSWRRVFGFQTALGNTTQNAENTKHQYQNRFKGVKTPPL